MNDVQLKFEMLSIQTDILIEEIVIPILKHHPDKLHLYCKYLRLKELIKRCQEYEFTFLDWKQLNEEGLLTEQDKIWFKEELEKVDLIG